ncbi:MAG: cyclic pyranopterin phosphate synthase [Candidatus Paceibacteria bacterium]|jgi:cyclic pyranopterin phosphate synthase
MTVLDTHQRPLRNLRISVTDRCNLRCGYCMPEDEYAWMPKSTVLTLEEMGTLVEAFCLLGVRKLRLTGGEPLLRNGLEEFIGNLRSQGMLEEIAMTTNGTLLAERAESLKAAGLGRLTVSLDTLRRDRFEQLSRRDGLEQVMAGLAAAKAAGFRKTKIDTVVLRGQNDDELIDLVEYGRDTQAEVRFIEYMDVGGATRWSMDHVVSKLEILKVLEQHYGKIESQGVRNSAPADRYFLPDGTVFGIISSTTEPFCSACDRARIAADGTWYTCLYANTGKDLRGLLRSGLGAKDLAELIAKGWSLRSDRGAEERLAQQERGASLNTEELQRDTRLEMHSRGG